MKFNNFQTGYRCIKCGIILRTKHITHDYEYVKKCFEDGGYTLLSTEYKGANYKLRYKCPEGHIGEISFDKFQQGRRCAKCYRYPYDDMWFRSKEEIECYKLLKEELKVSFEYEFPIGTKLIDFFINGQLFWEHHPDIKFHNTETTEEYYKRRRKLLDENGFNNYPLIVTASLNEFDKIRDALNLHDENQNQNKSG